MSVEVQFADNGRGVLLVCAGLVTGQELIDANRKVFSSEERLKRIRYAVVDQTGTESVDLTFTDLKKIEEENRRFAPFNPGLVVALVVDKPLPLTLSRVWDARTRDVSWEKRLFGRKDEAFAWLKEKMRDRFGMEVTGE